MRYVALMFILTLCMIFVWPFISSLGKKLYAKATGQWEEFDNELNSDKTDDE